MSIEYAQAVDGRVYDALRWVAQEARAHIMSGEMNVEGLRRALKMLEQTYEHVKHLEAVPEIVVKHPDRCDCQACRPELYFKGV